MRAYVSIGFLLIILILILGGVTTSGFANEKWEFFDYFTLSGEFKSEDIKVYIKIGKTQKNGIIELFEKSVASDKNSVGHKQLATLREFCMYWTCTGQYEGSKKEGIPVKEQLKTYIVDCENRKYSSLGTEWYGYDGASLGRSYWNPPPQKPKADFPSEQDTAEAQLKKILDYVCNIDQ